MTPDLELVRIGRGESFKAWEHGYPFRTVRWHFHPEYELHQVIRTSGHCFVGDYIGAFRPGNLILTGPNLPHNWISDLPEGRSVPLRSRIVQFPEHFIANASAVFPELKDTLPLLGASKRGVQFSPAVANRVAPMIAELVATSGLSRIEIFLRVLGMLCADQRAQQLSTPGYIPYPSGFMATGINEALAFINANLTEQFSQTDLARIAGMSTTAFSRSFHRHTGLTLVHYVNRLRISLACQLLMRAEPMKITDVCFSSGFQNLSNFNRQFRARKGMTPSHFRALFAENKIAASVA